jgi:Txe/YoeB family toxin of Txe-Axe toxin-antitoxin module
VKSKAHGHFWTGYHALPVEIQKRAREKFRLWRKEPFNPAFHFKELIRDVWSVRINQNHRALGRRRGDLIVWFWIGTHPE